MSGSDKVDKSREALRALLRHREFFHRCNAEYIFIHRHLVLHPTLPLPQLTLDHVQDCCNKTFPIYWIGPGTRGAAYVFDILYKQWYCGFKNDLEFGRFPAKLIRIEKAKAEVTTQDILELHNALCKQITATLSTFKGCEVTTTGSRFEEKNGLFGINAQQHDQYRLQTSFHSMFMVISEPPEDEENETVYLISTDMAPELSQPLSFKAIQDGTKGANSSEGKILVTTLPAALKYLVDLDKREREVNKLERDITILDKRLGSREECDTGARSRGYTGRELQGPPSEWVQVEEGELIEPPKGIMPFRTTSEAVWRDFWTCQN